MKMLNTNTAPIDKDLVIPKGTTKAYEVQITKNGMSEDITDWTIIFIVKEKMGDPDTSAIINKTITVHSEPTSGKSLIRLEIVDTDIPAKSYYYAVKFTDDEALPNTGIIVRGKLTIERTV
jgi:hypothetical protein